MTVYIRRFTEDPGLDVLLDIESVNIIDLEPPEAFAGVGTGTALLVGEFENGPFNTPTEVFGPSDLVSTFGEFGYAYDGVKGNNPCARSRKADGAVIPEYWNGNGFVHLNGKKFRRLILTRVDTSVGSVEFTRLAALTGLFKPTYDLEPGQFLNLATDLAGPVNVAFNATAATITGSPFVGALLGGDSVVLGYDAASDFTVTFLATDTTIAAAIARINLAAGFTFAVEDAGAIKLTGRQRGLGGEVRVVSESPAGVTAKLGLALGGTKGATTSNAVFPVALQPGDTFDGKVDQQLVADTLTIAATTATYTGAAATYAAVVAGHSLELVINGIPGTQSIVFTGAENSQATFLATINAALVGGAAMDSGGQIMIQTDRKGSGAGGEIISGDADVLASLGFAPALLVNAGPNNVIDVLAVTAAEFAGLLTATFTGGTAGSTGIAVGTTQVTWETNTAGATPSGVQFTGGTGVAKIAGYDLLEHNGIAGIAAVTNGTGNVQNIDAVTVSEVNTLVNAAIPTLAVMRDYDQNIVICNTTKTGVAEVEVGATTTALDFGFPVGVGVQATADENVTIPAGTRVRNAGGDEWVTMESVLAEATNYTGWTAKVRHAIDDGTGSAALVSTVNVLPFPILGGVFSVDNPLPLTNALDELELDAAYYAAIQTTTDLNTVAKEANFIWSARQSNICRRAVRENAILASERGCRGRMCAIRPPIGTTRAVAMGNAEPGVGAYRHERVMYAFPGVSTYVPAIALKGVSGGAGFTANGIVSQGADGFAVSVCCRLPSEENPGQLTTFMDAVQGLESGAEYAGWVIDDYKAFKRAGIIAPRMDDGIAIFQSGVTSVDPTVTPARVRITRRRMADEIQDSLAAISKRYGKRMSSRQRRQQFVLDCKGYMESLLSPNDPTKRRIDSYSVDPNRSNTPTSLAAGAYYVFVQAKTYPSLDAIVIQSEVGENVVITEV